LFYKTVLKETYSLKFTSLTCIGYNEIVKWKIRRIEN
jgi:hypothetical protein